ncbi:MAG: T9SS type A sorting domain-containing protein [Ignavibacteriales bacterium]|nr:T9SS type A sorting domain-containing protein [Ignavibacteriales bacterium]
MKHFILLSITAICIATLLPAQDDESDALQQTEMRRYASLARVFSKTSAAVQPVDITYYRLNVRIADQSGFIRGDVTALAVVNDSITTISYDLASALTVDSVFFNGSPVPAIRSGETISIPLPKAYSHGDTIMTQIFYHGYPPYTGLGSYSDVVRSDGTRWVYTLSEPYGARDWWPCIDHPNEKADSVDIIVTCKEEYVAASNGKLTDTLTNEDGTKTYTWKHRYPVSTYLIAVTIGKFNTFSDWFKHSASDSMEVVNYVLPDIASTSPSYRANAALTVKMLETFTPLFGPYPFIKEKYGHVQFGWGGGMEHQTLTSLGSNSFSEATIAHELVHQWFGDLITCRTWKDLLLNEGFAQYFEVVWREKQYGMPAYWTRIATRLSSAKSAVGTLYVQDTADVYNLFAGSRVYNKGASVLHMLRHVLGDSIFFAAIKAYASDHALMYGTAATANFHYWCETVSGKDLDWFFNEWVFGEKYPKYSYTHSSVATDSGFLSTVRITQSTGTVNPKYFTMPVDLKFSATNWDTTVTIFNDTIDQTFTIRLSHNATAVQLDPEQWILRDATFNPTGIAEQPAQMPERFVLMQNFPNPFNPETVIRFSVAPAPSPLPLGEGAGEWARERVSLKVYDLLGREVATLVNEQKQPGTYDVRFDGSNLPSGVYIYQVRAGTNVETRRMVLMK